MATQTPLALPASGLTRQVYRCRLPLALASRLEALFEMHPEKKRSQVMADVLGLGLAELDRAGAAAEPAGFHADTRQAVYLPTGPFAEFRGLAHKHHLAMEKASEAPLTPPPANGYGLDEPA